MSLQTPNYKSNKIDFYHMDKPRLYTEPDATTGEEAINLKIRNAKEKPKLKEDFDEYIKNLISYNKK